MRQKTDRHQEDAERTIKDIRRQISQRHRNSHESLFVRITENVDVLAG